mmetsp:Transcript_39416/g.101029  ORF Transcript_39416/g.101029 Transcript_39416/m.101029 type:complete len:114 (+) Transcript_39416:19-360(+)
MTYACKRKKKRKKEKDKEGRPCMHIDICTSSHEYVLVPKALRYCVLHLHIRTHKVGDAKGGGKKNKETLLKRVIKNIWERIKNTEMEVLTHTPAYYIRTCARAHTIAKTHIKQ